MSAPLKPQRITLGDGKTIDLKPPAGVEEGTRIRLAGKGQQGPAGPGDATVGTGEVRVGQVQPERLQEGAKRGGNTGLPDVVAAARGRKRDGAWWSRGRERGSSL